MNGKCNLLEYSKMRRLFVSVLVITLQPQLQIHPEPVLEVDLGPLNILSLPGGTMLSFVRRGHKRDSVACSFWCAPSGHSFPQHVLLQQLQLLQCPAASNNQQPTAPLVTPPPCMFPVRHLLVNSFPQHLQAPLQLLCHPVNHSCAPPTGSGSLLEVRACLCVDLSKP